MSIDHFIMIGGQKCGSNSLNRYLSTHPQIFLPTQLASAFFAHTPYFERGLDWYWQEWYSEARPDQVTGEISVPYLLYKKPVERIAAALPDVKLIALVRDPVERAYSHYNMALRWQAENAPFAECVDRLLRRGRVDDERLEVTAKDNLEYIQTGEYGTSLESWYEAFPASSIRVIFFEEYFASPEQTTRELFRWFGVDEDFTPACLGQQFHAGGTNRFPRISRWSFQTIQRLKRNQLINSLYQQHLPKPLRHRYRRARSWFDKEFNVKPIPVPPMEDKVRQKLVAHYRKDVKKLERLIGRQVPWSELSTDRASFSAA